MATMGTVGKKDPSIAYALKIKTSDLAGSSVCVSGTPECHGALAEYAFMGADLPGAAANSVDAKDKTHLTAVDT